MDSGSSRMAKAALIAVVAIALVVGLVVTLGDSRSDGSDGHRTEGVNLATS